MLVDFCIYLSPRELMASILNTFVFCPLNAESSLRFVRGESLGSAGGVLGDILERLEEFGTPKEKEN